MSSPDRRRRQGQPARSAGGDAGSAAGWRWGDPHGTDVRHPERVRERAGARYPVQAGQGQGDRSGRRAGGNGRGAGARRQGLDKGGAQGQPRRCRGAAVGQEGLQDARRHPVVAGSGGDFAVVPVEPAQAAQGCPDAGAAGHPGRRGRGGTGRFRHRQPHREPLLRVVGHRPGRQEHDAGVLLRPAGHQCRRVSARRHRQDPDQEDRCAGCGHDGRRHRLRLCQGRL